MRSVRQIVVSGLVIVGPLSITLIAVIYLLRAIADLSIVATVEPAYLRPPVVLLLLVVLVFAVGYLMRTAAGVVIADTITSAINHIPILRMVYNASHLAIETVLSEDTDRAEPVRVEAWSGLRVTAFKTGKRTDDGRVVCFLPTAPNITTGYVIEVREEDITPTGERIEQALTRLLSAGFGDGQDQQQVDFPGTNGKVSGVDIDRSE